MVIVISAVLVFGTMLPFAIWMAIGAARANRAREAADGRAPENRYGNEAQDGQRPNALGVAWARTTTFIE